MLEKIQKLIKESNSIPEGQKAIYLETIKHLPEESLKQLEGILTKEKEGLEQIQTKFQADSSATNKKHMDEIKTLVKEEKKKAVSQEEEEEEVGSEKVLNELNNL